MNNLVIGAAILSAIGVAIAVIVISAAPIKPPIAAAAAAPEPEAVTADRLKPKLVRVIPITRTAQPEPIVEPPEPSEPSTTLAEPTPAAGPPARHRGDICARYGGHRVDYGRRWRCVYPSRARRVRGQ